MIAPGNPDSFSFTVTLSEKPAAFDKGKISVDVLRATVDSVIALPAIAEDPPDTDQEGDSTEASNRVYPYLVTITPTYATKDDIVIKINSFDDTNKPVRPISL